MMLRKKITNGVHKDIYKFRILKHSLYGNTVLINGNTVSSLLNRLTLALELINIYQLHAIQIDLALVQ